MVALYRDTVTSPCLHLQTSRNKSDQSTYIVCLSTNQHYHSFTYTPTYSFIKIPPKTSSRCTNLKVRPAYQRKYLPTCQHHKDSINTKMIKLSSTNQHNPAFTHTCSTCRLQPTSGSGLSQTSVSVVPHRPLSLWSLTDLCLCGLSQTSVSVDSHRPLSLWSLTDLCLCGLSQTSVSVDSHRPLSLWSLTDLCLCGLSQTSVSVDSDRPLSLWSLTDLCLCGLS